MISNRIFKINSQNCFVNIKAVYVYLNKKNYVSFTAQTRFQSSLTEVQINKNVPRSDSSLVEKSSSPVLKAFQVLRTKPRGYDDVTFMLELSNKTLGSLSLLKSHELADICEILALHKYRNILLMHGISESFYWLCKLKKVKLRELSRFLKSCYILRYIPNVRYLDAFFKEIDDVRHVKSVGDHLRFLQFLVHSDLWISEKYVKMYLRLYDHCTKHMGQMSHSQLASFSQTQLVVDDSDQDIFEMICLNFERELSSSDISHLRMVNNSLLRSNISDVPTAFARTLKYYVNEFSDSITPEFTVEALAVLAKFYYRDTECLNKIGVGISQNIHNYSYSQLASCLNQFASLSYKHKPLIIAVSRYITESSNNDLFSKFSLIASLSNLISKVKYSHIGSINSVSEVLNDAIAEIKKLIESDNNSIDTNTVDNSTMGNVFNNYNNTENGSNLSNFIFKQSKQKYLSSDCNAILTTDSFIRDTNEFEGEKAERPRRSILRKLKRSLPLVRENKNKEAKLKYVPESTDIISFQSLSEYFSNFYSTYFNGEHPALRRLNNRRSMKQQIKKYKRGPDFEFSKSLSNVYYEMKHDSSVNSSIRRIKYKMKYSGSRVVQPSTFYINQVKILKRCFLSPFVKLNADPTLCRFNKKPDSVVDKLEPIDSLVGNNSLMYVDNKVFLKPYHQKYRFKHKTMKEFRKIMGLSNKVDRIIKYFTDNNLWNYTHNEDSIITSQPCIIDYIASVISSLSRLNCMPFYLYKSVLELLMPRLIEVVSSNYRREGSNVNISRFLNSINKIVNSMRMIMIRDRSGMIVSKLEELLCSEGFVSLVTDYVKEEDVEYRLCHKLIDHMCRTSFCKYLKDPNFRDENAPNSRLSGSVLDQNKRFSTLLSTICKLICIIDERGFAYKTDLKDNSLVDLVNNIIYVSWLSKLVQGKDESFNGLIEGMSSDMSTKISGILQKYVWKIVESLDKNECDTHLIQKYMDALNRYKELRKYDEERIGVDSEQYGSKYIKSDEEDESSVEDSYTRIMNKYKLSSGLINSEDQLLCEIKNRLIPKFGIMGAGSEIHFYKNSIICPTLLYYYYYNYYCNF